MKNMEIVLALIPALMGYPEETGFGAFLRSQVTLLYKELDGLGLTWKLGEECFLVKISILRNRAYARFTFPGYAPAEWVCQITSDRDMTEYLNARSEEFSAALLEQIGDRALLDGIDWLEETEIDVARELDKRVKDLVIAVNLASPGLFQIGTGLIRIGEQERGVIEGINNSLVMAYEEAWEKNWPEFVPVTVGEIWEWMNEKTHVMDNVGHTPADRALNAFSYTFNSNHYEDLFYVLLGVEALYNTGRADGIKEQLRTKTSALFGEPSEYKKRIGRMYDARSAFVHGRMNFPGKFHIRDAQEEFEKFYREDYESTVNTALCILIATLRKLVRENAQELKSTVSVELR
ncbi:hypothetical protein [Anaerolentibacter hominis]|uniref:hypothetical protein n=1 Tax=Anaerolentibacter hominis TaxID=3079009 RepID=UPI0031B7FBFA